MGTEMGDKVGTGIGEKDVKRNLREGPDRREGWERDWREGWENEL